MKTIYGFTEGDFTKVYAGQICEEDGNFVFINLSDRKQLELQFSQGKPLSSLTITAEQTTESMESGENCTYITVIRWFYNLSTGAIIDYLIIYEGVFCEDCLPGEVDCDTGGGGGSGDEDNGDPKTTQLSFLVNERPAGSNRQEIWAHYTAEYDKYVDNMRNRFTSVTLFGASSLVFVGSSFYQFEATELGHGHSYFASWYEIENTANIASNGAQVRVNVKGSIIYPNLNPPDGRIIPIHNWKYFYAKDY